MRRRAARNRVTELSCKRLVSPIRKPSRAASHAVAHDGHASRRRCIAVGGPRRQTTAPRSGISRRRLSIGTTGFSARSVPTPSTLPAGPRATDCRDRLPCPGLSALMARSSPTATDIREPQARSAIETERAPMRSRKRRRKPRARPPAIGILAWETGPGQQRSGPPLFLCPRCAIPCRRVPFGRHSDVALGIDTEVPVGAIEEECTRHSASNWLSYVRGSRHILSAAWE
jgi:hypothetical protein